MTTLRSMLALLGAVALAVLLASAAARAELALRGHGGPVKSVAVSADGRHALTASFDYSMIHWRLDEKGGSVIRRYTDHHGAVNAAAFFAGASRAISASDDGTVGIWDLEAGKLITRLEGHTAKTVAVAVSPDGKLAVSGGWDKTARIWDIAAQKQTALLSQHRGNVNAVAFSTNGKQVFTGSHDGSIRAFDAGTGEFRRAIYNHGWGVNVIAPLPDGKHIMFGALDGTVALVEIETGNKVRDLAKHSGPALSVRVWPGRNLAGAGGGDGFVRLWDITDWSLKDEHENPYGPVWSLALTGDGDTVFYAGLDDFVLGWQIRPKKPFEPVDSVYPRRFQRTKDMEPGEREFARKCSICHTLTPDDANRAGPTLYKLFGRRAGTLPGYNYSKALRDSDIIWTEETVGKLFDDGPDEFVPGPKMPLQRLKSVQRRDELIAFLKRATEPDEAKAGAAEKTRMDTDKPGEKE